MLDLWQATLYVNFQGCLPLSLRGFPLFFLGDTSCSVRDPELNQSRNA